MSESLRLTVPDISCDHCKTTIETALMSLDGVDAAEVDVDDRSVAVKYSAAELTIAGIVAAIEDQGYEVNR